MCFYTVSEMNENSCKKHGEHADEHASIHNVGNEMKLM